MVYTRTIGEKTFTFIVSGKLWRNSLIMQDKETNSLWSHVTGESMDGPMKGQQLEYIPSVQTTWADWVEQHPETKVLRKEKAVRNSAYESYFKDPDRIGIFRTRWLIEQMPGKGLIHGITRGPHAVAIADEKLNTCQILNIRVGEDPFVVVRAADGGVRAFYAGTRGKKLHFHRDSHSPRILDKETGSIWNLDSGECIRGELKGVTLEEEVVRTAFWFAWSNFYPNTGVIK